MAEHLADLENRDEATTVKTLEISGRDFSLSEASVSGYKEDLFMKPLSLGIVSVMLLDTERNNLGLSDGRSCPKGFKLRLKLEAQEECWFIHVFTIKNKNCSSMHDALHTEEKEHCYWPMHLVWNLLRKDEIRWIYPEKYADRFYLREETGDFLLRQHRKNMQPQHRKGWDLFPGSSATVFIVFEMIQIGAWIIVQWLADLLLNRSHQIPRLDLIKLRMNWPKSGANSVLLYHFFASFAYLLWLRSV